MRAHVEHLRPDISVTLDRVERQRAHLWTVAALFILLSSVAVAIVLSGDDPADVFPESPPLRWALLGTGLAFVLYVVDQERRLRRVTRALFEAEAATAVLNARYEEQRATVEQLAEALERRSESVATLVHELKTPLTAIVGFTSVLTQRAEQLDEDKRTEMVGAVREQAQRLRQMVNEVLRVASADAGADLRREPVDLRELAERGVESVRAVAVGRDGAPRDVTIGVADDLPTVYGDSDALQRVLDNLLENAVKYSPAGTPVEVSVEPSGSEVHVAVTDHGGGIGSEDLESIFERFRRGPGVLGDGDGAGLGLYIVRSLVGAHGGRVWATSDPGTRTTFTVALPVRSLADADEATPEVVSSVAERRGPR